MSTIFTPPIWRAAIYCCLTTPMNRAQSSANDCLMLVMLNLERAIGIKWLRCIGAVGDAQVVPPMLLNALIDRVPPGLGNICRLLLLLFAGLALFALSFAFGFQLTQLDVGLPFCQLVGAVAEQPKASNRTGHDGTYQARGNCRWRSGVNKQLFTLMPQLRPATSLASVAWKSRSALQRNGPPAAGQFFSEARKKRPRRPNYPTEAVPCPSPSPTTLSS